MPLGKNVILYGTVAAAPKYLSRRYELKEGVALSRGEVNKFFEVRLFSLAIVAAIVFAFFLFLSFFFALRGEYAYTATMVALAIVMLVAGIVVFQYARKLRRYNA